MNNIAKDVIVLGGGPGGYIAAIRASQLGRQVSIVEKANLGGICLNWGCIPSKALLKSVQILNDIKQADKFGISVGEYHADFAKIVERSREIAGKLSNGVSFLMKKNKIEVISGAGSIEPGNKLSVTNSDNITTIFDFKDIIIATGARPKIIPGVEIDGEVFHTSRTILACKQQPNKLLVVGAGAIGVELAYFFSSLGTEVTLVEMLDRILPIEDHEISAQLNRILTRKGMKIFTGCAVQQLKKNGQSAQAVLKSSDGEIPWEGDACLIAVGVSGNTENLGLEKIGVKTERGFIEVDEFMQTNVPHHYAIGDVAGAPWLAHVASHEGITAAEHLAGKSPHKMSYDNIPGCTYCHPQVASVGLTENAAKEKGLSYKVSKVPFSAIGKAVATGDTDGFLKLITNSETGEIYGVHILHAEATELISEAVVARAHEGIPASVLNAIHPHPTLSEALAEGMAIALGQPMNT